ncbi:uncharacterized protein LOC127642221 [Xyrauchen texanus]|uniref:uncharacterized protein LOC127642221 n=1 Tax=Xyrauchen texanus TaxID=154827 RepID=UPI002242939C|nr:uncharacterized protein LOC127642221 [Xyrauchen texanus]
MSLLLPLLFLWGLTAPVESILNPQKLQNIWTYISNTYPNMMNGNNPMYAVALSISNDDCNGDIDLQTILTGNGNNIKDKLEKDIMNKLEKDIKDKLKKDIKDKLEKDIKDKLEKEGGMYIGDRLMIARPLENIEHAEHRLLTQLKKKKWDTNSCVVFFVKDSPCTEKCLNEQKNNYNILELLETFKEWGKDKKAFLFQDIYYQDLDNRKQQELQKQIKDLRDQEFSETVIKQRLNVHDIPPTPPTRSQLLSAFQRIEEHVPLYRCNTYTTKGCIRCLNDEISLNNNECLYGMAEETESDASFHQSSSSQTGSKRSHSQSSTNNPNEKNRKMSKKGV